MRWPSRRGDRTGTQHLVERRPSPAPHQEHAGRARRDGRVGGGSRERERGVDRARTGIDRAHPRYGSVRRIPSPRHVDRGSERERGRVSHGSRERPEPMHVTRGRVHRVERLGGPVGVLSTRDDQPPVRSGHGRVPQPDRERRHLDEVHAVPGGVHLASWGRSVEPSDEVHGGSDADRAQVREADGQVADHGALARGRVERLHEVGPRRGPAAEHEESSADHRARTVVHRAGEVPERGERTRRRVHPEHAADGRARPVEATRDDHARAVAHRDRSLDGDRESVSGGSHS